MTGYERLPKGKDYYIDDVSDLDGSVFSLGETKDAVDEHNYQNANYYSSKEVAENNARADRLMRQLRRWAVEHNEGEIDWKNSEQEKFYIEYNIISEYINFNSNYQLRRLGIVYFTSKEIAKQAIEEFKDELLWYFTEYIDHFVDVNKMEETQCDCENPEKLQAMQTLGFKYCPMCGKELKQ